MDFDGLRRATLALAAAASALAGCDKPAAPAAESLAPPVAVAASAPHPEAAASTPTGLRRIVLPARLQPGLPEWQFTVLAEAAPPAEGQLKLRAIEIRRGPGGEPLQRIEGLDTETPWSAEVPGLEFVDLNFDGYADLRLIEHLPAGGNVPWLNWLYDPATARFVASPALNAITALRVDAAQQELLSDWSDGPTREGTDAYGWRAGQLQPLRRETRDYTAPGRFVRTQSRWADGGWHVVAKKKGP